MRRFPSIVLLSASLLVVGCSSSRHVTTRPVNVTPGRVAEPPTRATLPPSTTTIPPLLAVARVHQVLSELFPTTTTTTTTAPADLAVPVREVPQPQSDIHANGSVNGYPCGGDLPPCYVLYRESRGIPTVVEGHGSPYTHASGLWQFMPSTWNDFQGYPYAAAAPPAVQNEKAREVWAGGAGCSNWVAC